MTIRVVIADDHQIVRQGLCSLLQHETDMDVVAEAENGRVALELASKHVPNVVVMDVTMPEMNGLEAIRRLATAMPNVRTLALSMHSDSRFVKEALDAGAAGYLLKDCAAEELVKAMRTVAANGRYLSPALSEVVPVGLSSTPMGSSHRSNMNCLSPRERQVLQLIAEGSNTKEIAFSLDVSVKTIETHRMQIMKKLRLNSVAALTRYALRTGISPL